MENICAIDFETGCGNRASACAVGLAKIRSGKVTETFYSLIRPPDEMPILPFFENLHGISNTMVETAPDFFTLWPELQSFIGKDILIAHNAPFDRSVLFSSLQYWVLNPRSTALNAPSLYREEDGRFCTIINSARCVII